MGGGGWWGGWISRINLHLSTNLCECLFSFKFYSHCITHSITPVLLNVCTQKDLYLQKRLGDNIGVSTVVNKG